MRLLNKIPKLQLNLLKCRAGNTDDMNSNLVNGVFYSPGDMTSMEITAEVYVDRTSVEVCIDNGAYSYSLERKPVLAPKEVIQFWGNQIEVKTLKFTQQNQSGNKT